MTAVLPVSCEDSPRFSPDPVRCAVAQRYFLRDPCLPIKSPPTHDDFPPPDCPSPVSSSSSSSPPHSPELLPAALEEDLSSDTALSSLSESDDEKELVLPSYDGQWVGKKNAEDQAPEKDQEKDNEGDKFEDSDQASTASTDASTATPLPNLSPSADDTSIEVEPSRHVDYLSHEWKEEDIWSSWRYVTTRKNTYGNGVRLENASWRTWAKRKYNLGTISPETLNWLKDCDVTWLYGPLKTFHRLEIVPMSSATSRMESNSYMDRKPILKKKSVSETILQRSLSQNTLLQHASAIVKAQEADRSRSRPSFPATMPAHSTPYLPTSALPTASSSSLTSPCEKRHIHFNNEVFQCIAVEAKDADEDDDSLSVSLDNSFPKNDIVMKHSSSNTPTSPKKTSFNGESKTIAPLPPTTLNHSDAPEPSADTDLDFWSDTCSTSTLRPATSTKTTWPSKPQADFLLDDDDDDYDDDLGFDWGPSRTYDPSRLRPRSLDAEAEEKDRHLRLTSSGMLMPYDETDLPTYGLFDKVVDTFNTAKDIAHVIWNVGWRR